jgi:hypothetical protein
MQKRIFIERFTLEKFNLIRKLKIKTITKTSKLKINIKIRGQTTESQSISIKCHNIKLIIKNGIVII